MPTHCHLSSQGQVCLAVHGEFTYTCEAHFHEAAYLAYDAPAHAPLVLDLGGVVYMDTAAIGQLLILRERIHPRPIVLANCSETARVVLDILHLGNLFALPAPRPVSLIN
ncbi:STAS domain-containing protein [Chitiniphilus eburneus]|uniref:STAS domain-containing protein n=1 Tax=Chitiniphilus eburneus TaxID=2571148 RepID=UPI00145DCDF7|nr:STAS domain-containing protein [Chitiniphilus eburneus]